MFCELVEIPEQTVTCEILEKEFAGKETWPVQTKKIVCVEFSADFIFRLPVSFFCKRPEDGARSPSYLFLIFLKFYFRTNLWK